MKKFFEKHEMAMCMVLIVLYIVVNSFCINHFGIGDVRSSAINTVFSLVLVGLMLMLGRVSYYGLVGVKDCKKYLYFIPLAFIISVNFWNGIHITESTSTIVFYIITMLNVGFIEEVIFRGFLFKMMAKENVKSAIIVSSVTFGIGHIINLLNGADVVPTLLQVGYAVCIGYLFVIIFYKSGSIIPCIIAHSLNNSFSVFNTENTLSLYIIPVFLMVAPLLYALYLNKTIKE